MAWKRREGTLLHRLGSTATGLALVALAVFVVTYNLLAIHLNY
jgi:hypothetical protein